MSVRPSSLPALAQCSRWESDQTTGTSDKDAGTLRHKWLACLLERAPRPDTDLPEDEFEAVKWAGDYIVCHAPMSDYPLVSEYHVNPLGPDFNPLFPNGGTLDVACGPHLFDLKWRERDCQAQLAAYSLYLLQDLGHERVKAVALFAESRKPVEYEFTEESATKLVYGILADVANPDTQPKRCEACGWCAKRMTCPATTGAVEVVAKGYSDLDKVKSWHPSKMETGEELGLALWLWRTVLKKWGESVEFHALDAHLKKGLTIHGFQPLSKKGKTFVSDVAAAFGLAGLPQEEFLKACALRMNTSKKYPDQRGVVDIYAALHGMKKAPAKRDLLAKLEPVIKTGADSVYLKAVGGEDDTEE